MKIKAEFEVETYDQMCSVLQFAKATGIKLLVGVEATAAAAKPKNKPVVQRKGKKGRRIGQAKLGQGSAPEEGSTARQLWALAERPLSKREIAELAASKGIVDTERALHSLHRMVARGQLVPLKP